MDLNYTRDTTGGAEGLDLVTRIRAIDQMIPLVVMTAWGNVDLAVEAMRREPLTSCKSLGAIISFWKK